MKIRHLVLLCVAGAVSVACASAPPLIRSYVQPDPGGCYLLVFDQPRFMGAREFINGPAMHRSLAALPFDQNWQRRIRSVQVGIGVADGTAWADENFAGASVPLRPDREYAALDTNLSGEIESLLFTCIAASPVAVAE